MMKLLIPVAVFAWLPSLLADEPQPSKKLSMQWVEGEAIHLAGRGGAINRHGSIQIELELLPDGKLRGSDTGKRSEHNLYENFSTDEETKWKNTWSGTWEQGADTLRFSLTLADRKCKRTKSMSDSAPEKETCGPLSKRIQWKCRSEQITVEELPTAKESANRKPQKQAAWFCIPGDGAELGEAPLHWVFGKTSCLQTIGGRHGASYHPCSRDSAP